MIEKFFSNNLADEVFDPSPSYSGDWYFGVENLLKNAITTEDGKNLFQEFYKEVYEKNLEEIFKTTDILKAKVGFVSTPNENNIGRCLKFNKMDFFIEITGFLNKNIDKFRLNEQENNKRICLLFNKNSEGNESLNEAYSNALKEKAKKLQDVTDKTFNSEYYEAAMKDYEPYQMLISFEDYLKKEYELTKKLQQGMLELGNFFEQKIDYNALYKTFNPDKFCLLFAKIIYEHNLECEKNEGILDNNYSYLVGYREAIKKAVKENGDYNEKISYIFPNGKKLRYSRWHFLDELNKMSERHPEIKEIKLPEFEDENALKDIGLINRIKGLYDKEVKVNWEFLPEGEGIKKGNLKKTASTNDKKIDDNKEELINEVNLRIDILENSGFIGSIVKGINTFTGYYAFIYANGTVILEKFWENVDEMIPAIGCATYVMNIDNFLEMSKISKVKLIEYIKLLPNVGVKRIFHTSINNWQRNLYNEINGTYRVEDAINFINTLDGVRNEK